MTTQALIQPTKVDSEGVDFEELKQNNKKMTFEEKPMGGSTKVSSSAVLKRGNDAVSRVKSEKDLFTDQTKKENGTKVLSIPELGLYEGHTVNSIPHGEGKLKLKNGDYYDG